MYCNCTDLAKMAHRLKTLTLCIEFQRCLLYQPLYPWIPCPWRWRGSVGNWKNSEEQQRVWLRQALAKSDKGRLWPSLTEAGFGQVWQRQAMAKSDKGRLWPSLSKAGYGQVWPRQALAKSDRGRLWPSLTEACFGQVWQRQAMAKSDRGMLWPRFKFKL